MKNKIFTVLLGMSMVTLAFTGCNKADTTKESSASQAV